MDNEVVGQDVGLTPVAEQPGAAASAGIPSRTRRSSDERHHQALVSKSPSLEGPTAPSPNFDAGTELKRNAQHGGGTSAEDGSLGSQLILLPKPGQIRPEPPLYALPSITLLLANMRAFFAETSTDGPRFTRERSLVRNCVGVGQPRPFRAALLARP